MKCSKKLLALLMVMALAVCLAEPASAGDIDPNDPFHKPDGDTDHGIMLSPSPSIAYVLNQYTSATSTPSGTRVTTWKVTGHRTQGWQYLVDSQGHRILACVNNPGVALNINRSYSTPEVNVYALKNNYYADVTIYTEKVNNQGGFRYYTKKRDAHTGNMYITITNEPAPASDGNGTSWLCRWTTNSTTLYAEDFRDAMRRMQPSMFNWWGAYQ